MDPQGSFKRTIEPLDEEAIKQELVSTTPAPQPQAIPVPLADIPPVARPIHQAEAMPPPNELTEKDHHVWIKSVVIGAILALIFVAVLHGVAQVVLSAIGTPSTTGSASDVAAINTDISVIYSIPWISLVVTAIIGLVILYFVRLAHKRLFLASILLVSLGLFTFALFVMGTLTEISTSDFFHLTYMLTLIGPGGSWVYSVAPVVGALAGLLTAISIKLLTKRLTPLIAGIAILLVALIPLTVAYAVGVVMTNVTQQTASKAVNSSPISTSASTSEKSLAGTETGAYSDNVVSFVVPAGWTWKQTRLGVNTTITVISADDTETVIVFYYPGSTATLQGSYRDDKQFAQYGQNSLNYQEFTVDGVPAFSYDSYQDSESAVNHETRSIEILKDDLLVTVHYVVPSTISGILLDNQVNTFLASFKIQ